MKAFRFMVNRSVNWADWDTELLSLEMLDLKGLDFALELIGFDSKEIDEFLLDTTADASTDEIPAVPENPVTLPGDLWALGDHRVLCGHATSSEAVSRLLGDRKPFLLSGATTKAGTFRSTR